jgi:hypothetical protein
MVRHAVLLQIYILANIEVAEDKINLKGSFRRLEGNTSWQPAKSVQVRFTAHGKT